MRNRRTRTSRRVGAAAPVALAAALFAAGCGGDSEPDQIASTTVATTTTATTTATAPAATARRPGRTTTTSKGAAKTSRAKTTTAESTPPPPPPAAKPGSTTTTAKTVKVPPARAKLGPIQRFSGTGDRELGTVKLARSAVVRWTVSGASFELRDGSGKLKISGNGKTGQSFAAAGSYRSVKVKASGSWTLSVTALGS